ncbi:hypothetical protein CWB96_17955 [Pseudoalteromonas citrea]|uniref:Uncharacterized protein n=1 Tax=Pseudoalteromonas citrea TaxID=43655 RepID=A0A5S3XM73_9GAMM|nr:MULTISPECIES: hypothetical protein [Pseudoalteromonas]RJE76521.1 hypothetical protein BGP78_12905 [Pseudoalteromonas sp. MSK9-3]TMP41286.1 hypothetical protein CWB97_15045 [Pseudoalteromonas citrea]TMP55124.1 hypothetical protein CWB96_17955 [Pseudoalteromonas citrea]
MVSQANTTSHPHYNPIFERLVIDSSEDSKYRLIGMLAYADYKLEKYQWKEQYRQVHGDSSVPPEVVANFLLNYHDAKLKKLLSDAEATFLSFAEHYAEQRIDDLYDELKDDAVAKTVKSESEAIQHTIGLNSDSWGSAILKGALGSALFAVMIFVFSVLFSVAKPSSNYGKLIQFIIGGEEYVILPMNDCRLVDSKKTCPEN